MRFELSQRDREVVQTVSRMTQVSSHHIQALHFNDVTDNPLYRSLRRLKAQKLIREVGVRSVSYKGGAVPTVYALGPKGWWYVQKNGAYKTVSGVQEHTLTIADLYVELVEQERRGAIKLLPETSFEHTVGGMRVDLFIDVALPAIRKRRRFYVEVQRNARKDIIGGKLDAHWSAYNTSAETNWPRVAFVSVDDYMVQDIKRQLPAEKKALFSAFTLDGLVEEVCAQ